MQSNCQRCLAQEALARELAYWQRPNIDALLAIAIWRRHRFSGIQSTPQSELQSILPVALS
jgi:hypothetical protein